LFVRVLDEAHTARRAAAVLRLFCQRAAVRDV